MHGRVKVKTTAEQQEAKRKEREKKLKLYTAATNKVFEKRKKGEYDEEALKLTGEILSMNPDFSTLWNFRKEIFLHLKEIRSKDDMQAIFADELLFLESCLRVNPKSYGVWQHRCFVMDTTPIPDWKQELQLCNLFLEYDERNFHCWDYRRFVVKRANIAEEDELEFTTNKISNNFSNFSSWHYRSKLLPKIYPDENSTIGVTEEILLKEYETVQNAFFTDPDDQSAWFYHRWLIGRGQKKIGVNCVYASRERQCVIVTMTQPVKVSPSINELTVSINGVMEEGIWQTQKQNTDCYSNVWIFQSEDSSPILEAHSKLEINVEADYPEWGSSETLYLNSDQSENWTLTQEDCGSRFSHELSAATSDTLQRELQSVQELYELEPENKWVLLTLVSLMKALNPVRHAKQTEELIEKLQQIDPYRLAYYKDLRSKFIIENYLEEYDFNERTVTLSSQKLTTLYHPELLVLVVKLDLSCNELVDVKKFSSFVCMKELILDSNKICDVKELGLLKNLMQLSLKNNLISSADSLQPLRGCTKLTILNIHGNPFQNSVDSSQISAMISSLKVVPLHATVNAEFYAHIIQVDLTNTMRKDQQEVLRSEVTLDQDNALAYNANFVQKNLQKLNIDALANPLYNSVLTLCDLWLVPVLKGYHLATHYDSREEPNLPMTESLRVMSHDGLGLGHVSRAWESRTKKRIKFKVGYFQKQ